jgi:Tfp pilus assembly protein PilF
MFTGRLNPKVYIRRALIKAQAGKVQQAEKLFLKALAQQSDDVQTMLLLGDLLASNERLRDGREWYRKAYEVAPNNAEVLYRMGMALGAARKYEDAMVWYERALQHVHTRQNKLTAECWLNLGVAQWQVRMFSQAFTSWETALKFDSSLEKAKYFLKELANEYGQPQQTHTSLNDIAAFRKVKIEQYLQSRGIKAFQTKEEAAEVLSLISDLWVQFPDKEKLDDMTAAEKLRVFKDVPLDISPS